MVVNKQSGAFPLIPACLILAASEAAVSEDLSKVRTSKTNVRVFKIHAWLRVSPS